MKLDESILEQLDLEAASVKEPVNVMRVQQIITTSDRMRV